MAHMQLEVERQMKKKSPIADMVSVNSASMDITKRSQVWNFNQKFFTCATIPVRCQDILLSKQDLCSLLHSVEFRIRQKL